ncbi:MAG: hypothetical protein OIN87_04925 [Candidatus Methanoperedens sp.]|nr:hypothetical protein [Candidatus Methanoperedens sp.]
MVAKNKTPNTLKTLIMLIAKNNGVTISDITKKKKMSYKNLDILNKSGILAFERSMESSDNKINLIKFKKDLATFQKIIQILDKKELVKLMSTKYYQDNLKLYCEELVASLGDFDGKSPLDRDYLEYSLGNSPSTVNFFFLENDKRSLESFYHKGVFLAIENTSDKVRKDMVEKYNMYFIWENIIFEKIHEDLQNKNLLKENNYYNGYLPVTKKKLEKLMEYRSSIKKKDEISFFDEILGLLRLKELRETY